MADDEDASEWRFETDEVATEGEEEPPDEDATDTDDGEWRYSLSDLQGEDDDDQSAVGGNVFGSLSSDTEIIEAGSPSLENTLFVIVGALLALVFFVQFYLLIG